MNPDYDSCNQHNRSKRCKIVEMDENMHHGPSCLQSQQQHALVQPYQLMMQVPHNCTHNKLCYKLCYKHCLKICYKLATSTDTAHIKLSTNSQKAPLQALQAHNKLYQPKMQAPHNCTPAKRWITKPMISFAPSLQQTLLTNTLTTKSATSSYQFISAKVAGSQLYTQQKLTCDKLYNKLTKSSTKSTIMKAYS